MDKYKGRETEMIGGVIHDVGPKEETPLTLVEYKKKYGSSSEWEYKKYLWALGHATDLEFRKTYYNEKPNALRGFHDNTHKPGPNTYKGDFSEYAFDEYGNPYRKDLE